MYRYIDICGLDNVIIRKKSNAKRLKITINSEKKVSVTIPINTPFREGEKFVKNNLDWIKNKLSQLDERGTELLFNQDSEFITRSYKIAFKISTDVYFGAFLEGNTMMFYYNPEEVDFKDNRIQSFIKNNILKLLQIEGTDYLVKRCVKLSSKHNLKPTDISVGTASTRLGSCSNNNRVRLSCKLLLLPDHLIDYVILHELSHIIHKNHSKDFHDLLNKLSNGKSAELNQELKTYSLNVIPGNYKY